jgi:hypothetical protein
VAGIVRESTSCRGVKSFLIRFSKIAYRDIVTIMLLIY